MYNDLYIVKYLHQAMSRPGNKTHWERGPDGGYSAIVGRGAKKVTINIVCAPTRPISRVILTLSARELGEISIPEPLPKVFSFRKRYDTEDEKELSEILNSLLRTVGTKVAREELNDMETEEERKQRIFELLFNSPL